MAERGKFVAILGQNSLSANAYDAEQVHFSMDGRAIAKPGGYKGIVFSSNHMTPLVTGAVMFAHDNRSEYGRHIYVV